jgi:hypothetical protein
MQIIDCVWAFMAKRCSQIEKSRKSSKEKIFWTSLQNTKLFDLNISIKKITFLNEKFQFIIEKEINKR